MPKIFWGIDIGFSSVKAVKAEAIDGKLTLLDCMVIPIAPPADESDPALGSIESAKNALKILIEDKGLEGVPVGISISGRNVFSRYFNLPPVENIQELIPLEAKMQIPFPLEEVVWDYHIFGMNAETMETDVAIFAVKRDVIEGILNVANELKLNVTVIQSSAFSILNFGVLEYGLEKPIVMLEGGSKNIDLVICDMANFWPRSLPINGTTFTKALQVKFQIPFDEAEKLKINLKESGQSDRIFKVIEPSLKELLGEFQRSIGFYRSQRKELNIDKILLTGNALRIPGLDSYIATGMSKEATYINKPVNIVIAESDGEPILTSEFGSFAIAIGLASQGLGVGFVKVNFIPKEVLLLQKLKKKKIYLVGALVLLLVTLIAGWIDASERKARFAALKKQASSLAITFDTEQNEFEVQQTSKVSLETTLKNSADYLQKDDFSYQILNVLLVDCIADVDKNIWFSKIKTNWEERFDVYNIMKVKREDLDPIIRDSKAKLLRVEIEGVTQNIDLKGSEFLIKYNHNLEAYAVNGNKLLPALVQVPIGAESPPVIIKNPPPKLFLKTSDLDPRDEIGKERFEDAVKRISEIKDTKTNFYKFKNFFYVDFEVLTLPKKVVEVPIEKQPETPGTK
jgi:type IV pilus assembly protein PilM